MKNSIFHSELLKTKRSILWRIAIVSPIILALLATIQGGYFSLNLFNWFYVIFLPATFSIIGAGAVAMDYKKHGLRTLRSMPVAQEKIWTAKLFVAEGAAFLSCFLLSVAVIMIPGIFRMVGILQIKPLTVGTSLLGIVAMFLTTMWQVPFAFLLSKRLGLIFTVFVNLFVSFSGVVAALHSYWLFCPWAWVNRTMIDVIGVLPNGLPVKQQGYTGPYDVILALGLSFILTFILSILTIKDFGTTEGR